LKLLRGASTSAGVAMGVSSVKKSHATNLIVFGYLLISIVILKSAAAASSEYYDLQPPYMQWI
jgi:hypothetical protein